MSNGTNKKGLLIGFLIGGAIGGAIALLYAPQKGKRLRHDIGKKTGEIYESGRKIAVDSWNGVKETAENTLDKANDMLNSGMDKITRKTENLRDAFSAGMSRYAEERDTCSTNTNNTNTESRKETSFSGSNEETFGKIT